MNCTYRAVYFCGTEGMVEESNKILNRRNVEYDSYHLEMSYLNILI